MIASCTPAFDVSSADFLSLMKMRGWVKFSACLDTDFVDQLRSDLDAAATRCREFQIRSGLGGHTDGSAHHVLGTGDSFDEFFARKILFKPIGEFFGGPFILNAFGGFINRPGASAYVNRIHRDVRTFTRDFPLLINMLVMLDDFTADNGATRILNGSHHLPDKPSEEFFNAHADRFWVPRAISFSSIPIFGIPRARTIRPVSEEL